MSYHEAGHSLVGYFTEGADPVHKVTIIPRGRALGVTVSLPKEDRSLRSKRFLLGKLDTLMGGRCAEKIIFKDLGDHSVKVDLGPDLSQEITVTVEAA